MFSGGWSGAGVSAGYDIASGAKEDLRGSGMTGTVLNCPRDGSALVLGKAYGIQIDRCETCKGAWYDRDELALLEATVADEAERRGTIDYAKRESALACPKCGTRMRAFNYRAYNLELDACPEEHGFWLDAGEAERVRALMKERVKGLDRAARAQKSWSNRRGSGGGGVLDQLRDLFRRP
jgi:Zn-finger nucleic acid-binding protein